MSERSIKRGAIVVHPNKPDWGPGLVIKVEPGRILVVWRDTPTREPKTMATSAVTLELAPEQSDPVLDSLTPSFNKAGKVIRGITSRTAGNRITTMSEPPTISVSAAIERFLERFPQGFRDANYVGGTARGTKRERAYKLDAHQKFRDAVGGGEYQRLLMNDPAELCDRLKRAIRSNNLCSVHDKTPFTDALEEVDQCLPYLQALEPILQEDMASEPEFDQYFHALSELPAKGSSPAKWPNATIYPYLYSPRIHVFLKPEVTKAAARSIQINLNYQARPNWLTYSRLLEIADRFMEHLAPLGAQDMIDIQSFIWVSYGGYK